MTEVHQDVESILVTSEEIQDKISSLAKQITEDYRGQDLLLVGVLKGAFVFMSDLAREIELPIEFDFMAVSSYGSATKSSGVVRILKDLDYEITDRHVLLVEDIIDSGLTISYLLRYLEAASSCFTRDLLSLLEERGASRTSGREVSRFRDPSRLRRGLRLQLRGEVPQPPLYRGASRVGLHATRGRRDGIAGGLLVKSPAATLEQR